MDRVFQTDQNDVDIWFFAQEVERRLDCHMGAVIAPHGINRNINFSHDRYQPEKSTVGLLDIAPDTGLGTLSGRVKTKKQRKSAVISLGSEHLATAVKTVRADVMTQMHFTRRRLNGCRRRGQKIMSTVHTTLRGGFFVLLNGHNDLLNLPN
jgi:hypothetical protein